MTVIAQLILFLSSYVPLFIFMTILNTFGTVSGEIATAILSIGSLIILLYILRHTKRLAPQELKIRTTKSRDGDVITYIVTYILPFTLTNPQNGREKITLILLIALISFLYIKSQLFYINPILALIGYRLFQITTERSTSILITQKGFIATPAILNVYRLSNFIYLEKKYV